MGENQKKEEVLQEKREARRKRRQRNQVLAYLVVIILIIAMAAGIVLGVHYLTTSAAEKEKNKVEQGNMVDDLLQSENPIVMPTEQPEEVEEIIAPPTYEQKLDVMVNAAIEVMPLEDKVAGLFIISPEQLVGVNKPVTTVGDETREALSKYALGGVVFNNKNMKSQEAFRGLVDAIVLYSKYPVFLSVEEEPGAASKVVQAKLGEKTEDAQVIAASGDTGKAYDTGKVMGTYLSGLGFNLCFGPVADLANVDKSVMTNRSFGNEPNTVLDYVQGMMQGMQEQGVTACVKHFPGLGSVTIDTAEGLAVSERTEEELRGAEFKVFQNLIDGGATVIMVSNMAVPSMTGDNTPVSFSSQVVTDVLRSEMKYDGLIITDALNEKAISEYHSSDEAAILALRAGCDMILMPEDFEQAYNGVLKAVQEGTISESRIDDALRRVYRIKYADRVEH